MTAYIGSKPIQNVLYFNRDKNTKINSGLLADMNYMDVNNRHEYYNDKFVILTDPSIYISGIYYQSFNDIPDVILDNNTIIFKNPYLFGATSSQLYHRTNPITRTCNYVIQKEFYYYNEPTHFSKDTEQWTYTFDGYNFKYKKEKWHSTENYTGDKNVEDEQSIHTNQITALIIKGPTASNDTYTVITYDIKDKDTYLVPNDFTSYKNISKLYAGEELVHENT